MDMFEIYIMIGASVAVGSVALSAVLGLVGVLADSDAFLSVGSWMTKAGLLGGVYLVTVGVLVGLFSGQL